MAMFMCQICHARYSVKLRGDNCCKDKKSSVELFESKLCPGFFVPCEDWLKGNARRDILWSIKHLRDRYATEDEKIVYTAWYGYFKCQEEIKKSEIKGDTDV